LFRQESKAAGLHGERGRVPDSGNQNSAACII
jgi:hypothetical protein